MRSFFFLLVVVSCGGELNQNITCAAGQRPLNGECLTECKKTTDCSSATCVGLDVNGGVCVDTTPVECAYLQSDTKCVGIDSYYFYGVRGNAEYVPLPSDPPTANKDNLTSNSDDTFLASGTYGTEGCQGNATYTNVAPSSDPACTARHDIVRCRRVNDTCKLVAGNTEEHYAP